MMLIGLTLSESLKCTVIRYERYTQQRFNKKVTARAADPFSISLGYASTIVKIDRVLH